MHKCYNYTKIKKGEPNLEKLKNCLDKWGHYTIGELAIAEKPMTTNQGFKNLVCKVGIDNVFMAYLLSTLKDIMISKAKGTTFLELSKKALETIKVKIPKYEEQQAIASVLTAMDKEIEHLEAERDKMTQIREGAMDDLLTGRVRLTV